LGGCDGRFTDFIRPHPSHPHVVIQDSWTISPTMFNEVRLGYNRVDLDRNFEGFENLKAFISVTGVGLNANLASFIHFTNNTYSVVDNFTNILHEYSRQAHAEGKCRSA
jgi:hypothetical protein